MSSKTKTIKNKRIAVAMSGGVDSSTTAALLKEQNNDVIGFTMKLLPIEGFDKKTVNKGKKRAKDMIKDAKRVAKVIGIDHHVVELEDVFKEKIVNYFFDEYLDGKTPNPCVKCNKQIKFDVLMKKASRLGCDYLATGHYVRKSYNKENNCYDLYKGIDEKKDQSYFLYQLSQDVLKKVIFPLGDYKKIEVRKLAKIMILPVAKKEESQEVCFVPDDNYAQFIQENSQKSIVPGIIADKEGNLLGEHKGLIYYTCGQRKGLGISSKAPLYVKEINKEENILVVAPENELYENSLIVKNISFVCTKSVKKIMRIEAQIRYKANPQDAEVSILSNKKAKVVFRKPQKAIAPGQSCVFYKGDTLIGGGIIEKVGGL